MAAEARARCKLVGRELPQLALESTAGPVDLRELGRGLLVLFLYPHATFAAGGRTFYRRLTLVAEKGVIVKVFYPVAAPDENAADVVAWLESRPPPDPDPGVGVAHERPRRNRPSSPARRRAVIFDLWDTLVAFPWDLIAERDAALAETVAVDLDRLRSTWRRLESAWQTGPLMPSLDLLCAELGLGDVDLERLRTVRVEYMRRALQPRREVVETLRELRRRGRRLGLISGCSGDVPIVWEETPFAGLFDGTVFSCDVGLRKPDIRIYSRAISVLRVAPSDCLYVGDGGNDELAGPRAPA